MRLILDKAKIPRFLVFKRQHYPGDESKSPTALRIYCAAASDTRVTVTLTCVCALEYWPVSFQFVYFADQARIYSTRVKFGFDPFFDDPGNLRLGKQREIEKAHKREYKRRPYCNIPIRGQPCRHPGCASQYCYKFLRDNTFDRRLVET